ncbi:MAG: general secretion pathway protein GspK, partial [Candidatus Hydrogenedentes bacterium]|nr:general secretion pathway protein GspK [Candidatus Hydrogenedentota bacterium]
LAVLGIVVAFGFAMYDYTILDQQSLEVDINEDRALLDARSGVQEAIAQLQDAIAAGNTDTLLGKDIAVAVSIYRLDGKQPDAAPSVDEHYNSEVTVKISDECAKMNVNLAPPAVLMSMLKIDGEAARQVRERLPRLDGSAGPADGRRRWLASLDDLAGLKVLPAEALTPERAADLTVFSALDLTAPAGYVNLNTASKAVLEAALGVTPDVADKVMLARPLTSAEALFAAAGKDANGFNFKPAPDNPGGLPKELAFTSRCFRVTSAARLTKSSSGKSATATVEAVVQFPENAPPQIVYWSGAS